MTRHPQTNRMGLPMCKILHKRAFSLLEMFIVIALLGIAGSLVGIKMHSLLIQHRFQRQSRMLTCELRFCQNMALANQANVYLDFFAEKNGVRMEAGDGTQGFFRGQPKTAARLDKVCLKFGGEPLLTFRLLFTPNSQIYPNVSIVMNDEHDGRVQINTAFL